jgi:hypothetical protein
VDHTDADPLELLDRIKARLPELDLAQQSVEWTTLPDGGEVLLVDGWSGGYFANHGDDLHAYGSLDPIVPGHVGCVVIEPDGTRRLARAVPDPLAE